MTDWIDRIRRAGPPAVLVTVAEARGSTPREAGTKMVVGADACSGTIGGGQLEYEATRVARELLATRRPEAVLCRFALGPSLGQCCGGDARVLFEPVDGDEPWFAALPASDADAEPVVLVTAIRPSGGKLVVGQDSVTGALADGRLQAEAVAAARAMLATSAASAHLQALADGGKILLEPVGSAGLHVVLFGAGHVGKALVRVLGEVPCRVTWVDGRAEQFPAEVPDNVTIECTEAPGYAVDRAPRGAAFLVMTHSHALDLKLCENILRRHDFSYFGLIGSQTKRAKFIRRFKARGIPQAQIDRMVCPIGIPGLSGKHPGVIAVGVAAQLLQVSGDAAVRAREATTAV